MPQSACCVRRISRLKTTLKYSKPFEQNILQLLKIVNKRMNSSATLDFSHFKSHRKTLSNALGLSLKAHLADLMDSRQSILAGAPDKKLKTVVTDFVNVILNGELPMPVREIFFGGRLIALEKKEGGIRPIAVGYTLRRLAAKCANSHVFKRRSEELQPVQVGAGVPEGAEAAVHAVRSSTSQSYAR